MCRFLCDEIFSWVSREGPPICIQPQEQCSITIIITFTYFTNPTQASKKSVAFWWCLCYGNNILMSNIRDQKWLKVRPVKQNECKSRKSERREANCDFTTRNGADGSRLQCLLSEARPAWLGVVMDTERSQRAQQRRVAVMQTVCGASQHQ